MKAFIVLAAFVVAVSAGSSRYGYTNGAAITTGTSSQWRSDDSNGNYNFGYQEQSASGSTSRREEQTNGVRRGSYSLNDADGRARIVDYVADLNGFRASIRTNEPGVDQNQEPADVLINKDGQAAPALPASPRYGGQLSSYGQAPLQAPLPAPLLAPLPAPLPAPARYQAAPAFAGVKGYGIAAPRAAPLPLPAPAAVEYGQAKEEYTDETPRAFSYSFGNNHVAPLAAPAYQPPAFSAPLPSPPTPIYQQRVEAY